MQKRVGLKDIADALGVSVATVSYALNNANVAISEETRSRVLQKAQEMHYSPNWMAKGLKSKRYNTIGVVVEDVRAFFINELIDGICQYAEESNVKVLLCNLRADSKVHTLSHDDLKEQRLMIEKQVENTFGTQVDGLLYAAAFYRDVSEVFMPEGYTVGYLYSTCVHDHVLSISYNDYQGAELAVDHLIAQGHRKIGIINGLHGTIPGDQRFAGYLHALEKAGIERVPEWERNCAYEREASRRQALELLSLPNRPTAVFGVSDQICWGIYQACHALGLHIPKDVSVIGFDNIDAGTFLHPSLTSISFPSRRIGYEAIKAMCEKRMEKMQLNCELVERHSVRRIESEA